MAEFLRAELELSSADELLAEYGQRVGTQAAGLMQRMGNSALDFVRDENFGKEQDPDGAAWEALSPKYAEWKNKHFGGRPKLRLRDELFASLAIRYTADYVDIGSIGGLEWAAIHNFGGGDIPRREYAGTSDAFIDALVETLGIWMEYGEWNDPAY